MKSLFFLSACFLLILLSASRMEAQPSSQVSGSSVARTVALPGAKCRVVSGPNAGKEGTFDAEGSCCDEQNWGCTDCEDHGRWNGKCEFARKIVVGGVVIGGVNIIVYEGNYLAGDNRLFRCLTSVNSKTGKVLKSDCYMIPVENLADLKNSKNATDKSIANAIEEASTKVAVNTK